MIVVRRATSGLAFTGELAEVIDTHHASIRVRSRKRAEPVTIPSEPPLEIIGLEPEWPAIQARRDEPRRVGLDRLARARMVALAAGLLAATLAAAKGAFWRGDVESTQVQALATVAQTPSARSVPDNVLPLIRPARALVSVPLEPSKQPEAKTATGFAGSNAGAVKSQAHPPIPVPIATPVTLVPKLAPRVEISAPQVPARRSLPALSTAKATVILDVQPCGVIQVDGSGRDLKVPTSLDLSAGRHTVRIRCAGYYTMQASFILDAGETVHLPIRLQPRW